MCVTHSVPFAAPDIYTEYMLKVGLTGGVACGKTTVAAMFEKLGAHVIRADEIAHQLMGPGTETTKKVVAQFGSEILNPDGTINRPKLADLAFHPGKIQQLNAIVHPAVIARQEAWMEEIGRTHQKPIAIVEAALLIEAGAHKRFDKLITVTCDFEQKVLRFAHRSHMSRNDARDEVQRRMTWQLADEEKARLANYVIDNSGTLAQAEEQVFKVWQKLKMFQATMQ